MRILAVSGSLRKVSYNSAAIHALKKLAPDGVEILMGDIGTLPLFNPDREDESIPALESLKAALGASSGLILATPEYAHGISGVLKNALDWLVGGFEFIDKPIMLINTSPRASHAQAHLREVLTTMSGIVIEKACVSIPVLSRGYDCEAIVQDKAMATALKAGLEYFCNEIRV